MATTVIDTAGWRVVVPLRTPLDLTGSRLTATIASQFGGRVVDLDSADLVPGYDGAREIDWVARADGLTDHLVLTVTRAMRDGWLAIGANGRPGLAALFADVKRTLADSAQDPELIGRTSFMAAPGTDSPAVAAATGGGSPVLVPIQGLQTITATALVTGPQGRPGVGAEQTIFEITGAASFTASHSYGFRPSVLLLLPSGEEVETDTFHAEDQVTLVFAQPFTGVLYLG